MTLELVLDHLERTHMLIGPSKEIHWSVPSDGNPILFSEGKKIQLSWGSLGEVPTNLPKI